MILQVLIYGSTNTTTILAHLLSNCELFFIFIYFVLVSIENIDQCDSSACPNEAITSLGLFKNHVLTTRGTIMSYSDDMRTLSRHNWTCACLLASLRGNSMNTALDGKRPVNLYWLVVAIH